MLTIGQEEVVKRIFSTCFILANFLLFSSFSVFFILFCGSSFWVLLFTLVWVSSVTVALMHVFIPFVSTFAVIARSAHKRKLHVYISNLAFLCGYVSFWFSVAAAFYLAMGFFGYSLSSESIYIVAGYVAIIAGLYKVISRDHIGTPRIMSPHLFFLKNWKDGHKGAFFMGLHYMFHAASSYWLLMILMLLAGYSNVLLLGAFTITIFAESNSSKPLFMSRVMGLCFIFVGVTTLFYAPFLMSLVK